MSTSVKDIKISARYDLQRASVQIFYETSSTIDGVASLSLVKDFYPNPLPTSAFDQFHTLQFTVDLQGAQANSSTATLTCDPISQTSSAWWLARHPQYKPYDPTNPADAGNNIASFTIDPNSIVRTANPATDNYGNPIADQGYYFELTTGNLAPWMTYPRGQRIKLSCKAVIVHRNGTAPQEIALTYQCLSTNMTSGTYSNQSISQYPEPVPVGLAQQLYEAISVLQFEGSLTLLEEDCSGSLSIGNGFNLVNGAGGLSEWASMNALVQSVTENLDTGETEVEFGPPRTLSAGELVDLLRVNRLRLIQYGYGTRAAGEAGNSGQVDLGTNTPEKNSVSGTAPSNPTVVSSSIDGTGAIVTHSSTGTDVFTSWANVPPPNATGTPPTNSITIRLSDANGNNLSIQPLQICLNGVQGTIYFLCSQFIPSSS